MSADWKAMARATDFRVSQDDSIEVALGNSRQIVHVDSAASDEALRLWSVVATESALREAADDAYLRYAWQKNRFADLVSFTVDRRQRLIGESWVPLAGLTADELALHLRELARICDWHEFRLSGADYY